MTAPRLPDRDTSQVDALVADRYLDTLLAAADRRGTGDPDDAGDDTRLGPDVRHAAQVLRRSLVRVHPSFRFEERLATRLAELAAAQSAQSVAGAGPGALIAFPGRRAMDPELDAILRGDLDPSAAEDLDRLPADRRPLLVTGAITSAALSLAGVAWVAWRASRPASRGAMGRAAREAHARRSGAVAGLGGQA